MNYRIPKLAVVSLVAFFTLSVMLRFVLPFGDEPDYNVKIFKIESRADFSFVTYFFWIFDIDFDLKSKCITSSSPFSIYSNIDNISCFEPIHVKFFRILSLVITIPPLVLLLSNRRLFKKVYPENTPNKEALFRAHCVFASLPFPGMIYFLGLLSVEHFTLVLGLIGFVFFDRIFILTVILICSAAFDAGNTTVAAFFFLNLNIFRMLSKNTASRLLVITYAISLPIALWVTGLDILNLSLFKVGLLEGKSNSIYQALSYGSASMVAEKYNILFRPVITIASLALVTPAYIKAPLSLLALMIWFLKWSLESSKIENSLKVRSSLLYFSTAIFTIFIFSTTLPIYAYGKYYALCIPSLLSIFVAAHGLKRTIFFSVGLTLLTFINILIFWI